MTLHELLRSSHLSSSSLAAAFLLALFAAGCKGESHSQEAPPPTATKGAGAQASAPRPSGTATPASGTPASGPRCYTVRGEVVKLPVAGAKPPQLLLRHEAIPDFVDHTGKASGMDPMTMPFDLAPSASTKELAVGDKVRARLDVDWSRPSAQIVSVEKLPAGTDLKLVK